MILYNFAPVSRLPQFMACYLARVAAALLASGCLLPTDESRSVFVTVEHGNGVVARGSDLALRAQAWSRATDGSVRSLDGATFTWTTSDSSIASLAAGAGGRATITGVRSGMVRIAAVPDQFTEASPGEAEIRVASTVEIDSVVPDTVRFGEQLTLYGVGLGAIDRAFLGDAPLIPVDGSFTGDSAGLGTTRYWVQAPASTQRLLAAVTTGFSASSPDTVVVVPEDVYETRDTVPIGISLDGPPVGSPAVLFYNPALSIEGVATAEDSVLARDNFIFTRSTAPGPLTIIFKASALPLGRFEANIHPFPLLDQSEDWGIGVETQSCIFFNFTARPRADSVIRVLEPASARSFRTDISGDRGNYSIEVREGVPPTQPGIEDDRFEYNDHCLAAERNFKEEERTIDLDLHRFEENLTISRPFDIDWYKFKVATAPSLISVRLTPLPGSAADSSDADLYVLNDSFEVLSTASTPRSSLEASQVVVDNPGEYFVVVLDQVGVPTQYSLCISLGTACAPQAAIRMGTSQPTSRHPGHATPRIQ